MISIENSEGLPRALVCSRDTGKPGPGLACGRGHCVGTGLNAPYEDLPRISGVSLATVACVPVSTHGRQSNSRLVWSLSPIGRIAIQLRFISLIRD